MKDVIITPEHPEGLSETQEKLALSLYDAGVILFDFEKGYRMKIHDYRPDLPLSPLYIDIRSLQSFPDAMAEAVGALAEQVHGLKFDRIAGVPMAGLPLATLLAHELRKPQITPRKDQKAHGIGRTIDGKYNPGDVILVTDDMVTTGGSKFEVIEVLTESGLIVRDVVVVFDRQQGAEQQMADRGIALHSALNIKPALQLYSRMGRISQEQAAQVTDYLESPLLK